MHHDASARGVWGRAPQQPPQPPCALTVLSLLQTRPVGRPGSPPAPLPPNSSPGQQEPGLSLLLGALTGYRREDGPRQTPGLGPVPWALGSRTAVRGSVRHEQRWGVGRARAQPMVTR